MKIVCKQCGKEFELSESEIEFYKSKNLHIPKRCKECREANKQKNKANVDISGGSYQTAHDNTNRYRNEYSNKYGKRFKNRDLLYEICLIALILCAVGGILFTHIDHNKEDTVILEQTTDSSIYDAEIYVTPENTADTPKIQDSTSEIQATPDSVADTPEIQDSTSEAQATPENVTDTPVTQYVFRNREYLEEHYNKHGKEMGFTTPEEYQAAASAVVANPDALHKTEAEDGDDVYYLEASNDFVIVSTDGYIRTYFRPDDGIDYYNRQ